MAKSKAHKIIDTNIFLTDPYSAPYSFKPKKRGLHNEIVIPLEVYKELDSIKREHSERGKSARHAIKVLADIQDRYGGNMFDEGVRVGRYYTIRIEQALKIAEGAKPAPYFLGESTDDKLVALALYYKDKGDAVEIVTSDNGVRHKGSAVGIEVSPWKKYSAVTSEDEIYRGWRQVIVNDLESIVRLASAGFSTAPSNLGVKNPMPNEYFLFKDSKSGKVAEGKYSNGMIRSLDYYLKDVHKKIVGKNSRQKFLMDALRDPNLDLIFALGPAGTGKTFLLLDAALSQIDPTARLDEDSGFRNRPRGIERLSAKKSVQRMIFEKVMIVRPAVGTSKDENPGFLPGNIYQKQGPFFLPIYDNLEKVFDLHEIQADERKRFQKFFEHASLYFMRGRSLAERFILVDEAQNMTIKKVMLMLTRISENTKIVLNGDFGQRDVDTFTNNGLSFANQAHIEDDKAATVYFTPEDVERSERVRRSIKFMQDEMKRRE